MGYAASIQPSGETVTASDLVRHFGHWQRRAVQGPVYVLNHGRPQFVLASVEFMQAVANARPAPAAIDLDALLDALPDPVLIVAADGDIVAAGRAARLHFGPAAQAGARLGDLLSDEAAAFLSAIVARVIATGIAERTELPEATAAPRLELTVEPAAAGAMIAGKAAGVADARDAAQAQVAALAGAATALPDTAIATIGPRGYLIAPDPSLSRLSGFAPHTLTTVRAANLFSVASRVAVGDAVETVFTAGAAMTLEAELLTAASGPLAVTIGLAPLRRGLVTTAVVAIIAKTRLRSA